MKTRQETARQSVSNKTRQDKRQEQEMETFSLMK